MNRLLGKPFLQPTNQQTMANPNLKKPPLPNDCWLSLTSVRTGWISNEKKKIQKDVLGLLLRHCPPRFSEETLQTGEAIKGITHIASS